MQPIPRTTTTTLHILLLCTYLTLHATTTQQHPDKPPTYPTITIQQTINLFHQYPKLHSKPHTKTTPQHQSKQPNNHTNHLIHTKTNTNLLTTQNLSTGLYAIIRNLFTPTKAHTIISAIQASGLSQNIHHYYRDFTKLPHSKSKLCKHLLQNHHHTTITIQDILQLPQTPHEYREEIHTQHTFHSKQQFAQSTLHSMTISPDSHYLLGQYKPTNNTTKPSNSITEAIYLLFPIYQTTQRPIAFKVLEQSNTIGFVQAHNNYHIAIGNHAYQITNYQQHHHRIPPTRTLSTNSDNPSQKQINTHINLVRTYSPRIHPQPPLFKQQQIYLRNIQDIIYATNAKHPYLFFIFATPHKNLHTKQKQCDILAVRLGTNLAIPIFANITHYVQAAHYQHHQHKHTHSQLFIATNNTIIAIDTKLFHWNDYKTKKINNKATNLHYDFALLTKKNNPQSAYHYYIKHFHNTAKPNITAIATYQHTPQHHPHIPSLSSNKPHPTHRLIVALQHTTLLIYDWKHPHKQPYNQRNMQLIPKYTLDTQAHILRIIVSDNLDKLLVATHHQTTQTTTPNTTKATHTYLHLGNPQTTKPATFQHHHQDPNPITGCTLYHLPALEQPTPHKATHLPPHSIHLKIDNQGKPIQDIAITNSIHHTTQYIFILNHNQPVRQIPITCNNSTTYTTHNTIEEIKYDQESD